MSANAPHKPALNLFHRALILTASLQRLPVWAMLLLFYGMALPLRAVWPDDGVPLVMVIMAQINALLLMLLPYFDRSHGPERASALGLGALFTLTAGLCGLVGLPASTAFLALILLTGIAVYSTWIEPFRIQVTRQRKHIKGWNATHPLRVLHLGDLHAEHFGPRERQLNQLIAALKPDVIVFSGDFINLSNVGDAPVRDIVRQIVAGWRAPLGLYAVSGTSPEIDVPDDVPFYVQDAEKAESVVGRWATVEAAGGTLHIGGIATYHDMQQDRAALGALLRDRPASGAHLLLIHTPDLAPEAIEAGADLYLCGHTHGGQLCLPGGIPIMTASQLGWRFARGRVDTGATTVYTSRGIGFEGLGAPRARFFCRPEIILWEITG